MQSYIGVIVLCALSALVSCIVHEVYSRIKKDAPYAGGIIKTFAFYFMVTFTILSLFKTILGNGNGALTLIESFDEVSYQTYLHYSLPLMVISVIVPFILRLILKERRNNFISMFLSLITGISAVVYLIFDRISNFQYLCIAIIGAVLALVISFVYKGEVQYCTHGALKKRLTLIMPVISFWIILMVLYLPNELYLGNINDMDLPYGIFVRTMLLEALGYFVIYTLLSVYFMTERQFSLLCELIFGFALSCYLQGMFMNGKLKLLDGSIQTWSAAKMVINVIIWVAVIALSVGLKYIVKRNTVKTYSVICIYLSLIQLVTWGYLGLTADFHQMENNLELTTDARLELDSENNVIVFVLDWFDVQIADKILAEDEDFLEPLHDFTWYKNATSAYAYTAMAIPYLLTDVEWQYDMEESDYMEYAYSNSTLLKDIAAMNYDIGVYTSNNYISPGFEDIVRNYLNVTTQGWNYVGIMKQMLHCSKYKSYPFVLKENYRYTGADIFRAMRSTNIHNVSDDTVFYDELFDNGIEVRNSSRYNGAFRFYHMHGVHPPIETDLPTRGRWSLELVYEYLNQMKAAGIYDEATIIITADHGQNYLAAGYEKQLSKYDLDMPSRPIMFVKKSYQTNEDGMHTSMAPVSHAQIAATVMEAVNGDASDYGETFDDIEDDRQYERYMTLRRHDVKVYNVVDYVKYAINGYAGDWDNWSMIEGEKTE